MWHTVVISCPLHKISHVAQLFHSQILSSVKHCLFLFLPLPKGSTNWVTMTTSQTAHTTSDTEMARSGLQLCNDTAFPIPSPTREDTQHCMGLQKPQVFLHCDFYTGNKVCLLQLNPHRHTNSHSHIIAFIQIFLQGISSPAKCQSQGCSSQIWSSKISKEQRLGQGLQHCLKDCGAFGSLWQRSHSTKQKTADPSIPSEVPPPAP